MGTKNEHPYRLQHLDLFRRPRADHRGIAMICSILECERPSRSMGMCTMHYARKARHGDPSVARGIHRRTNKTLAEIESILASETSACIKWPFSRTDKGYGYVDIDKKRHPVHRLICERAHGAPPTPKHQAAHSCGKGHFGCCNPRHLRWATAKENAQDRKVHGTQRYGERTPRAKLTERDVKHIRHWCARGYTQPRLAKEFGVAVSVINDIINGRSWAWL